MRYMLLVGLAVLFFSSFVSAATVIDWDNLDCQDLSYNGLPLSQAKVQLPNDLANFFNGEIVTLRVGDKVVSGKVEQGVFLNISCSSNPSSTFVVDVPPHAIDEIANSPNPMKTFKELKVKGDILIMPAGLVGTIKLFILNFVMLFV